MSFHRGLARAAIRAVHYKSFLDGEFDAEASAAALVRGLASYLPVSACHGAKVAGNFNRKHSVGDIEEAISGS